MKLPFSFLFTLLIYLSPIYAKNQINLSNIPIINLNKPEKTEQTFERIINQSVNKGIDKFSFKNTQIIKISELFATQMSQYFKLTPIRTKTGAFIERPIYEFCNISITSGVSVFAPRAGQEIKEWDKFGFPIGWPNMYLNITCYFNESFKHNGIFSIVSYNTKYKMWNWHFGVVVTTDVLPCLSKI